MSTLSQQSRSNQSVELWFSTTTFHAYWRWKNCWRSNFCTYWELLAAFAVWHPRYCLSSHSAWLKYRCSTFISALPSDLRSSRTYWLMIGCFCLTCLLSANCSITWPSYRRFCWGWLRDCAPSLAHLLDRSLKHCLLKHCLCSLALADSALLNASRWDHNASPFHSSDADLANQTCHTQPASTVAHDFLKLLNADFRCSERTCSRSFPEGCSRSFPAVRSDIHDDFLKCYRVCLRE